MTMEIRMKIGFTNRGIYDAGAEYDILDIAASDGAIYISRKGGNKGNPTSDGEWWQKAIDGAGGVTEEELRRVLEDYWSKAELTAIPTDALDTMG